MLSHLRALVYTVRGLLPGTIPGGVLAEAPSPEHHDIHPALASTIRRELNAICDSFFRVPRGTYTQIAHDVGTTPTYVSIVASRAGYTVRKGN